MITLSRKSTLTVIPGLEGQLLDRVNGTLVVHISKNILRKLPASTRAFVLDYLDGKKKPTSQEYKLFSKAIETKDLEALETMRKTVAFDFDRRATFDQDDATLFFDLQSA